MRAKLGVCLYRAILKEMRTVQCDTGRIYLHEKLDSRRMGWKWFPGGRLRALPTQFDVLEKIIPLRYAQLTTSIMVRLFFRVLRAETRQWITLRHSFQIASTWCAMMFALIAAWQVCVSRCGGGSG